jgi:hypothetical protein
LENWLLTISQFKLSHFERPFGPNALGLTQNGISIKNLRTHDALPKSLLMLRQGSVYILFPTFFMVACQKADVNLGALNALDGFAVQQSSVSSTQLSNPGFTISGTCNKNFSSIDISFDGGKTWCDLSGVSTATVNCKSDTGSGSFTANFNRDLTHSQCVPAGGFSASNGIKLRGSGDLGKSNLASVAVIMSLPKGYPMGIAAAGGFQAVGNYKVKVGVRSAASNGYQYHPPGAPTYTVKYLRVEAGK